MRKVFNLSARVAVVLACVCGCIQAQDRDTGLGRIYVRPMDKQLDVFLMDRIIKAKLPVAVVPVEDRADCVMLLAPEPVTPVRQMKSDRKLVLVDLQARRIVWEKSLTTLDISSLDAKSEAHLAATFVRGMKHDGAYCSGSAFGALTQSMEDRVKAFHPPLFNWDF